MLADPTVAITFSAAQWDAELGRRKARWALEDAGKAPRPVAVLPEPSEDEPLMDWDRYLCNREYLSC